MTNTTTIRAERHLHTTSQSLKLNHTHVLPRRYKWENHPGSHCCVLKTNNWLGHVAHFRKYLIWNAQWGEKWRCLPLTPVSAPAPTHSFLAASRRQWEWLRKTGCFQRVRHVDWVPSSHPVRGPAPAVAATGEWVSMEIHRGKFSLSLPLKQVSTTVNANTNTSQQFLGVVTEPHNYHYSLILEYFHDPLLLVPQNLCTY